LASESRCSSETCSCRAAQRSNGSRDGVGYGDLIDLAGKNLQAQYERWQPRAKYKTHLDPTMDDVKKLAISCRRSAKVSQK